MEARRGDDRVAYRRGRGRGLRVLGRIGRARLGKVLHGPPGR